MKKLAQTFFFVILSLLCLSSCKQNQKKEAVKIDQGFSNYISGFTSGMLSNQSSIRIRLNAENSEAVKLNEEISLKLFDFKPSIKGKAYWIDKKTIEFKPEGMLSSGTVYEVNFYLNKLMEVPDNYKTFAFKFQTKKLSFKLKDINLKPYNNSDTRINQLTGVLHTTDFIDEKKIESVLKAKFKQNEQPIVWKHIASENKHLFVVDSIRREEEGTELILSWDGASLGLEEKGEERVEISGLNEFKVIKIEVVHQPEQHVRIQFSDPLKQNQELRGLVRLKNQDNFKIVIEDNELKAYTQKRISGTKTLLIHKGIENSSGFKLKESSSTELTFEAIKPALQLLGKGVIVPNSDGVPFQFKAVNLNAVDLRIVKIYEDNVVQFFQENNYSGYSELKRVGRLVLKRKIDLVSENIIDYGKWNVFSFNIDDVIELEPGAIYRIDLSFKKAYSLYPCAGGNDSEDEIDGFTENDEAEYEYYDSPDNYFPYEYHYYEWKHRENPCHVAYYSDNKNVSRNVVASNLGIIAKMGEDKTLHVAVTDLRTTEPQSGVKLSLYNYQQQFITQINTDNQGRAVIKLTSMPFLLIAEKEKDKSFLKLNDGSSLSLSKFDVQGLKVEKGIKGFIYGERGVWRPGDTLFLNFILNDKNKVLPENHPIAFELINPEGKIVERSVQISTGQTIFPFITETDPDAPTGNWNARVSVGGAVFNKTIKIEAIKPNRLKIKIDFGDKIVHTQANGIKGDLQVNWLHGAVAKNLNAEVEMSLSPSKTVFKNYRNFTFDDPASKFYSNDFVVFKGKVDENGKASIVKSINVQKNAPGVLKAVFTSRVFEAGGDFSIDQFSIPYYPYDAYVGIQLPESDERNQMLVTDKKHTVELATVDASGNPISIDNIQVTVYKINWRWWWERSTENLGSYVTGRYHTPVITKKVASKDGYASFNFEIKYPAWGRYLIRAQLPGGHATGDIAYIDWPSWQARNQQDNPGGASMLIFSAEKEAYKVGEEIVVSIPSNENSRALVSIENGSKVIANYWLETEKDETIFKFKATEEMAPNIYIHVTLMQAHANTVNDMPIRLYGIIPVKVSDPATKLSPQIQMADELAPEKTVQLKISENDGKAMSYTIAVVDEGLLDLTRFQTPNPWLSFYAREALGVKTWDMFDYVLGDYGGKIEQLFAIGGDGEIINDGKKQANRFKPVVMYLGPFDLKAKETKTHSFLMPKYVGSVRTMVVAATKNGAYGFAEKSCPVKNPLMILATLPRVLGPGEDVKLPVTVFAMDKNIRTVDLEVKANSFFETTTLKKTMSFEEEGDQMAYFDLKLLKKLGVGEVKVIAKSGNFKAEYDIEIQVRNPNPLVVESKSIMIEPGKSATESIQAIGLHQTNKLSIEFSSMPPLNLEKRLGFLIRYPHGCIEQTTSAVFPQLFLSNLMEIDGEMQTKIEKNIQEGLNRLLKFQIGNGGFAYWPGGLEANAWGTNYAGHFMLEAEQKGYSLPIGLKDNWIRHQKDAANKWSVVDNKSYYKSDFIQAYRLYTLALADNPEIGAMNRLKESGTLSVQSKWRLAAAYALIGKPEIAKEIVANAETEVKEYRELSYTYGSSLRDMAMILETMTILKDYNASVPLVQKVSDQMSSDKWMSTQTTAFCLLSMAKLNGNKKSDKEINAEYQLNDKKKEKLKILSGMKQIETAFEKDKNTSVFIQNNSDGNLFVSFINQGIPLVDDQTEAENNLQLEISYLNKNNQLIDVSELKQGTDFKAVVKIKNPGSMGHYKELALTQIFPSGWEILNTRLFDSGTNQEGDKATYQDIRDDRVYTYFDLNAGAEKKFIVHLNAAYLGRFYLPTISCEAMYDNKISARKPGKWINVVN